MKVLSITQPYATLVASGIKTIENRSWNTTYRDKILIHSTDWSIDLFDKDLPLTLFHEYNSVIDMNGKKVRESQILDVIDNRLVLLDEAYRLQFNLLKTEIAKQADEKKTLFPVHAIVGQVSISNVVETRIDTVWSNNDSRYHWILSDAILFKKPLYEVKGKLRLWNFDRSVDSEPMVMVDS